MTPDSPLGQVISLSSKRLVQDVPAPGAGDAVLRDVLSGAPFDAAVTGFVLACLPDSAAPVMWVSDRMSAQLRSYVSYARRRPDLHPRRMA